MDTRTHTIQRVSCVWMRPVTRVFIHEEIAVADPLKVIVTGATGKIGRTLMEDLGARFSLTGTSRSPNDDPRFIQLDFDDVDVVTEALTGQDVVVHMHAKSNHNTDDFDEYLGPNIVSAWNVYEAARRAGVRRLIYASSNHATGWYEMVGERCDAESLPRPDGIYGAAKVWGETVGRYFSDRFGLEVIVLRIGSYEYRAKPTDFSMGPRILSTWLSDRDLVNLTERAIVAPAIQYGIYYGISANARAYWDITNAVSELGYRPKDNAEDYAEAVLAKGGVYSLWGFEVTGMV